MQIPADTIEALLDRWPVARLATLREDGSPAQVPIVFVRCDGGLWSPVDGKPKRSGALARLRHVAADSRVGLLLDHYADDWRMLWWIRLEGRGGVVRLERDAPAAVLPHVEAALRQKYPQYAEVPVFRGEPVALRIDILSLATWCAGEEALAGIAELLAEPG